MTQPGNIDEYIAGQAVAMQPLLQQMRAIISGAAAEAEETISYGMPAFRSHGRILVYFAAAKKHIGFYPTPSGIAAFAAELAGYVHAKGSVQFPADQPLPEALIQRMVAYRVQENAEARVRRK